MSEEHAARRRLSALYAASGALVAAQSYDEAAVKVLDALCAEGDWLFAAILLVSEEDGRLRATHTWSRDAPAAAKMDAATRTTSFAPGEGVPGAVLAAGTASWVRDLAAEPTYMRTSAALGAGLRAAIFFPVADGARVAGVFELYYGEVRDPDHDTLELLAGFCSLFGQFLARISAEAGTRRAADQLRTIVEGALDAIVSIDLDGRITEWNRRAEELFGWSRDEAVGQPMAQLIVPARFRDAHLAAVERYLETGVARVIGRRVELEATRKDGTQFPVELTLVRRPASGDSTFSAFMRDLTDQRQAETERGLVTSALRESEAAIRAIYDVTADATLELDAKIRALLELAIERTEMSTGLFVEQADGALRVRVAAGQRRWVEAGEAFTAKDLISGRVIETGSAIAVESIADSEWRGHPTYRQQGLQAYCGVPVLVGGKVAGTMSVSGYAPRAPFQPAEVEFLQLLAQWVGGELERDRYLAALTAANAELRDAIEKERELAIAADSANRAKGDFLAVMSHEMRTPMNGVLGMLEILRGSGLTAEQAPLADLAISSGKSLVAIIDEVLDFSRIEAGELRVVDGTVRLRDVLNEVATLQTSGARASGVEVTLEIGEDVPELMRGDRLRIWQVLSNLVANAAKFTEQGEIRISAQVSAEGGRRALEVRVEDTGPGIDETIIPRLFEPFTQADSSATRRHGGTGLGLAISHRLVGLMGGTLAYEPRSGGGSRFIVVLPCHEAVAAMEPEPDRQPRPPASESLRLARAGAAEEAAPARLGEPTETGEGPRILVVEDNTVNQTVALALLARMGYRAQLASNGAEAVALVGRETFDLILMDCRMPVMDGFEATRQIRALEAARSGRRTPIVALTANALDEERERSLRAGMDDHVAKPVGVAELAAALERWLARPPAAATAAAEDRPLVGRPDIDLRVLADVSGGDAAFERDAMTILRRDGQGLLTELRAAFADGDSERAAASAHALKGACATLGLRRCASDAAGIEQAARSGNLPPELLDRLGASFQGFEDWVVRRYPAA